MKSSQDLKSRWLTFVSAVLDPWVVVLLAVAIGLLVCELLYEPGTVIGAVLTILVSIFAGVAGAIMAKRWSDITERGVAMVRGESAIRSLTLLLNNVASLRNRLGEYMKRLPQEEHDKEVLKACFEEAIGRCSIMEQESINSIEDWADIIRKAEVRPIIATIRQIETKMGEQAEHIEDLQRELETVKGESEEQKEQAERLRKEKQEAERELAKTRRELQDTKDRSILSGLSGTASASLFEREATPFSDYISKPNPLLPFLYPQQEKCRKCGKLYTPDLTSVTVSLEDVDLCPDCARRRRTTSE